MKKLTILLLLISAFTLAYATYKTFLALSHPLKYEAIISENSLAAELDPSVIASIINVESSFNKNARSKRDAIGLMQIKLSTAQYVSSLNSLEEIDESDLYDPEINIKYGCLYFRYLLNKFKDVDLALASYNAGETIVRSWLKNSEYSKDGKTLENIPFEETDNYIKRIKSNLKFYEKYL